MTGKLIRLSGVGVGWVGSNDFNNRKVMKNRVMGLCVTVGAKCLD